MNPHTAYIHSLDYDLDSLLAVDLEPQSKVEDSGRERKRDRVIITTKRTIDLDTHLDEQALLDPNPTVVFPGAIVQQDRHLADGLPVPITVPRGPLTVKVELPGLGSRGSATIESPTNVAVSNTVEDIVTTWLQDPVSTVFKPPVRAFFDSRKSFTSEQISVQLGLGLQWGNNSVTASMDVESTHEKTIVYKAFKQVYYTVYIEEPTEVGDFFAPEADLEGSISAEHPPGYLRSVDYGRIIICRMETSSEQLKQDAEATLDYVTSGGAHLDSDLKEKYERIKKDSSFMAMALGGAGADAKDLLSGDPEMMQHAITEGVEFSPTHLGIPMAYVVADMKSREISAVKTRGKYTYVERKVLSDRWIKVHNVGWYDAKFQIRWSELDDDGVLIEKSWDSGRKNQGYDHTIYFPADAQDFEVSMMNWTGWVGEKHKYIKKRYSTLKSSLGFRTDGTTMSPGVVETWH